MRSCGNSLTALSFLVPFSASAFAQSIFDCADFDSQEEAPAVYDQDTDDSKGLDGRICVSGVRESEQGREGMTLNQIRQAVNRGQRPKGMIRVNKGNGYEDQDNTYFTGGRSHSSSHHSLPPSFSREVCSRPG